MIFLPIITKVISPMINGRPESLESQHSRWFGNPTADTTDIRAALLHALDHNTFVLLAQSIVSTRGEEPYHALPSAELFFH